MAKVIWDYAAELGVEMRNLTRVVDYINTETEHGVITESGERILADVVLESDWSRSKAREKLMGLRETNVHSGYAIFRTLFELTDEDRKNALILDATKGLTRNWTAGWVGPNVHGFMFIFDDAKVHSRLLKTLPQNRHLSSKAKGDVPLALQVFERIRFNRSYVIHQSSTSTRDVYHKHEWTPELIKEYSKSLSMAGFDWVTDFEVQEQACEHFDHLAEDVRSGKQGTIEELSLPAGGAFEEQVRVEELRLEDKKAPVVAPV
ncbi:hypothetical protein EDB80DRAFT_684302 [Ilyonectria destructans]|nr:hypothetical protein EDB80DRAFT_684302 [Ilyonectria destructans]